MFHTDRGKEFDNNLISEALETFGIQQSLRMKGCPYNNAVAAAMFKMFETEFTNQAHFYSPTVQTTNSSLNFNNQIHLDPLCTATNGVILL